MSEDWNWEKALNECIEEIRKEATKDYTIPYFRRQLEFDDKKRNGEDRSEYDTPLGRLKDLLKTDFGNWIPREFKTEAEWKVSSARQFLLKSARTIGKDAFFRAARRRDARRELGLKERIYRYDLKEAFEAYKADVCPAQATGKYCASVKWPPERPTGDEESRSGG
jgi:hypothetical protein